MCRLLAITSEGPMDARAHLDAFMRLCRASREHQGHGWGFAVWRDGRWERHRTARPIWEDDARPQGEVRVLLAHARSAFRDEGIEEESAMPFLSGERAFAFNGELRGVRLAMEGRTGAEKLFTYINRMETPRMEEAIGKAMAVVRKRTARIRAANFILAEPGRFHVHSLFDGGADYFTLHRRRTGGETVVCSEPYPGDGAGWEPIPNDTREVVPWCS